MKSYNLKVNNKDYKVDIESITDNKAEVLCNEKRYEVIFEESSVQTKTPVISRKAAVPIVDTTKTHSRADHAAANVIKAPIPGLITEVLVKQGDIIKGGDVVAKMEAMKMENNILASSDGKIKYVGIKVGDSVLEGDVLIDLEDA
ncbi:MAG: acetyl-CoA carboxylase biotin carboxyl carrier protein subunit [Candidatus Neomarinimicrobiota bacterium]|nr:MAG: acetyl-CoA carboxylase biotin carboxyl carrier protein subunit [Candidatus Neomarinimicrobiota bacterium]